MREFNKFEKQLIKKIVVIDFEKSNIGDFIIDNILKNRMIQFERESKRISIYSRKNDDKNEFLTELIETLSLIEYLEKNNLVFIQDDPNILTRNQGNILIQKSDSFKYSKEKDWIVDKEGKKIDLDATHIETSIYEQLTRYTYSFFTPGTELKEYVKNGFISAEQKKHNQILFWTRAAFFATLIPYLNWVYDSFGNESNSARRNSINQLHDDLIDINRNINNKSFPETIKAVITNDVVKVVIEQHEKEIKTQPIIKK